VNEMTMGMYGKTVGLYVEAKDVTGGGSTVEAYFPFDAMQSGIARAGELISSCIDGSLR